MVFLFVFLPNCAVFLEIILQIFLKSLSGVQKQRVFLRNCFLHKSAQSFGNACRKVFFLSICITKIYFKF